MDSGWQVTSGEVSAQLWALVALKVTVCRIKVRVGGGGSGGTVLVPEPEGPRFESRPPPVPHRRGVSEQDAAPATRLLVLCHRCVSVCMTG